MGSTAWNLYKCVDYTMYSMYHNNYCFLTITVFCLSPQEPRIPTFPRIVGGWWGYLIIYAFATEINVKFFWNGSKSIQCVIYIQVHYCEDVKFYLPHYYLHINHHTHWSLWLLLSPHIFLSFKNCIYYGYNCSWLYYMLVSKFFLRR